VCPIGHPRYIRETATSQAVVGAGAFGYLTGRIEPVCADVFVTATRSSQNV